MDPAAILATAINAPDTGLMAVVGDVAPLALTVAVAVFGLRFGWNVLKSFVH